MSIQELGSMGEFVGALAVLEHPELARIMVKARGADPLDAEEELLYELLFERLFFIGAGSVQSSVQGATSISWEAGDVDFLLELFKAHPAGVKKWNDLKHVVRSISPAYVNAVDAALDSR